MFSRRATSGPTLPTQDVYLRTAISVEQGGWAHFDYVKMPDYRWGIFLNPGETDRVVLLRRVEATRHLAHVLLVDPPHDDARGPLDLGRPSSDIMWKSHWTRAGCPSHTPLSLPPVCDRSWPAVMVMGTSSCHMLNSEAERSVPGVAGDRRRHRADQVPLVPVQVEEHDHDQL